MSNETNIQILQLAKSKLTPESWFQEKTDFGPEGYDTEKHCCFYLALCKASRECDLLTVSQSLCRQVAANLEQVRDGRWAWAKDDPIGKIIDWNDVPGRTVEEVHAKIDEAIAGLQAAP